MSLEENSYLQAALSLASEQPSRMPTTSGVSSASRLLNIIQDDGASKSEKEEAFSEELSRLKHAQKTQGSSIKLILRKLHLDEVPKDVAMAHDLLIRQAYEEMKKCQGCTHSPKKAKTCYVPTLYYDAERRELSAPLQSCPFVSKHERESAELEESLSEMLLSPHFRNRTFDNFRPSAQSQRIYTYAKNWAMHYPEQERGLFFFGSYGCGKTHLAVASLLEVRRRYEKDALFLVVPTFLQELKSLFQDGKRFQEHLTRYQCATLLVIDDLGEGQKVNGTLTSWVKETLFSLINYRYEHDLKTILTSHYPPPELEHVLGMATVSRLCEMCDFLEIDDPDYRKRSFRIIK